MSAIFFRSFGVEVSGRFIARIMDGLFTSARAMGHVEFVRHSSSWVCGRERSASFTLSSIPMHVRCVLFGDACNKLGSATFSTAVKRGSRLNCWNTKLISELRISARSLSGSLLTSFPLRIYLPQGVSRHPWIFINVLFTRNWRAPSMPQIHSSWFQD